MTRGLGRGWRGIDVCVSILRSRNSDYRMHKEPFPLVASTRTTLACSSAMPGASLAGHPESRSLPSSADFQMTGPHLRGQPNMEDWAKVTAMRHLSKNSGLLKKRALSKSDLFSNQHLVMSSSYICISRMFYALFSFEQVPSHLCALADVLS